MAMKKSEQTPRISESKTNKLIVEPLTRAGCYVWRNNSGVARDGGRYIRYGLPGSSDIIGITSDGRFIAVENKTNGEPLKPNQVDFLEQIRGRGGVTFIIGTISEIDDMLEYLRGFNTGRASIPGLPPDAKIKPSWMVSEDI